MIPLWFGSTYKALTACTVCTLPCVQGGYTALIRGAMRGHLDVVKKLLAAGANTDLQTTVTRGEGLGVCLCGLVAWWVGVGWVGGYMGGWTYG